MKFLDLFAGIGGFRLGLEQAGHKCIGYVEIDKFARKSYQAIHDTEGEWTAHDITAVTDDDIRRLGDRERVDIIAGGFPCQSFSIAGKRGGFKDARGTLFFDIMRFADILRPRYLFLENVVGLLGHDNGRTFETILRTLDEVGYDAEWDVLNTKDFSTGDKPTPQNRERIFIIGHLRGASTRKVFPVEEGAGSADIKIAGTTKPEGSTRIGNRDQVHDTGGSSMTLLSTDYKQPKQILQLIGGQQGNRVYDPDGLSVTLSSEGGGQGAKTGLYAVPVLTPEREEKRQNGRRFKENGEPSFTLTSQDRHGVYDGYRIRKLTPKECWRLQGFPDWAFDKAAEVNSDSQLYKQAGNSVTVNVIHEIAKRMGVSA